LPTTRSKASKSAAFTLVELLLVVVILGVMATIAIPRYSGSFSRMKVRSGAYDFAATVEHAQATAILEGHRIRLSIEPNGRSCRMESEWAEEGGSAFKPVRYALPEGVRFEDVAFENPLASSRWYLIFEPDGGTDRCRVKVAGGAGGYWIYVAEGLGRVRVVRTKG